MTVAEINNFKENATPKSTKDATKFGVLVNFILYKSVLLITQEFKNNCPTNVLMFVYITKIYFFKYEMHFCHFSPK